MRVISISDEMPGPWRPELVESHDLRQSNFNLRREARPLATPSFIPEHQFKRQFQSQTRSQAPGDLLYLQIQSLNTRISISDEKPGPWRRCPLVYPLISIYLFQSQTRSQAPGDYNAFTHSLLCWFISISDEKPGPWRQLIPKTARTV